MKVHISKDVEKEVTIDLIVESADKFLAPYKEELSNMLYPKNGSTYDAINNKIEELKKFNSPIPEYVPIDKEGLRLNYEYLYVYDLSEENEHNMPTDHCDALLHVVTDTNGREIYRIMSSFCVGRAFARLVVVLGQQNFDFLIYTIYDNHWKIGTIKCIINKNSNRVNPKNVSFAVHAILKDLAVLKEREYCEAVYDAIEKQMKEL